MIRLRYRVLGGHVHCRLFVAAPPQTTATFSGDLVFRVEEWDHIREAAAKAGVELVPEAVSMTMHELAVYLQKPSGESARKWARRHHLPMTKVGGKWRIDVRDVDRTLTAEGGI